MLLKMCYVSEDEYNKRFSEHRKHEGGDLGSLLGLVGTVASGIKSNLPLIMQAGGAAASIANAVKGGIDAAKSAEELSRERNFNKELELLKVIKEIKNSQMPQQPQPTQEPVSKITDEQIDNFNKLIKGGKGLKMF